MTTIKGSVAKRLRYEENLKDVQIEVVEREYVESRRWVEVWRVVFRDDSKLGTFYEFYYDIPATEIQEGSETEYSDDEDVNVQLVRPVPRTIIKYVRAEE